MYISACENTFSMNIPTLNGLRFNARKLVLHANSGRPDGWMMEQQFYSVWKGDTLYNNQNRIKKCRLHILTNISCLTSENSSCVCGDSYTCHVADFAMHWLKYTYTCTTVQVSD